MEASGAVMRGRPGAVGELVRNLRRVQRKGVPANTDAGDEYAWRKWLAFSDIEPNGGVDVDTMRPCLLEGEAAREEGVLHAIFLVWLSLNIEPRADKRREGFTRGAPSSCMTVYNSLKRVLRDCSCEMPPGTEVRSAFKGLMAEHKELFGPDANVPEHQEPFTSSELDAMFVALRERRVGGWSTCKHDAMMLALTHGLSTGDRRDNYTGSADYTEARLFEWQNTASTLEGMPDGTLLRGRRAPSKCDRFLVHWGDHKQWFRLRRGDPRNFADRWRLWQIQHPGACGAGGGHAAFSPLGNGEAWGYDQLARAFRELQVAAFGEARRTWHAIRVTLACMCAAAGISGGDTQAILAWRSVASLAHYARLAECPRRYADMLDLAHRHDAAGVDVDALPVIDGRRPLEEMHNIAETLERADAPRGGAATAAAARPARAANPPRAARTAATRTRRGAPAAAPAVAPAAATRRFRVGSKYIVAALTDPHGLVGSTVDVPDSEWGGRYVHSTSSTPSTVCGFVAGGSGDGSDAYVMRAEDYLYVFRAATVVTAAGRT